MSVIKDITGIVVCYNTKKLMECTYNSFRRFHPEMSLIIIDGSDPNNPCASYVKSLASDKTTVISAGKNIGHGRGMCKGIEMAKTKYALIFDSDIEMIKSPVSQMLKMMDETTFGVGNICKTGLSGGKIKDISMLYLHPYFQLININNYKKYHPYVHHGAPCYLTMRDIHKKKLSGKVLKLFPNLLKDYVIHYRRGTRDERFKNGKPEIEFPWEVK